MLWPQQQPSRMAHDMNFGHSICGSSLMPISLECFAVSAVMNHFQILFACVPDSSNPKLTFQ